MNDITQHLPQIVAAYLVYLVAVISPGPAIMAIVSTSICDGRRAGLAMAAGVFAGSFTWAMAASIGLAALLTQYAGFLQMVKIAGGLYLLYLAAKALRSASRKDDHILPATGNPEKRSLRRIFLLGYAIHLTNPKAIFAWVAIISLGLPANASAQAVAFIVGGCLLTGMTVFTGYAILFSTARAFRVYRAARRGIDATLGVLFAAAGIKLLATRI
ncbi:LysE family translocator [Rhizobium sp. S-51]|uniref:LysE family translocator n=1 Tax=Rhizobium terricola TaxID=2728849 RepID=A0A7Y0AYA9_9HYPH|nr:LysE family translocator [Rhizobium terricola]NML75746.1 LysE family translocator [Rhizobium terricola]